MNPNSYSNSTDAEHHVQLGLAQTLCEAAGTGVDAALTREILDQLVAYSDVHFLSEQLLMRLCGYPDYDDHMSDHDRLMTKLEAAKQYGDGAQTITASEAETILALLAQHISTKDRRFVDFFRGWSQHTANAGSP
ncbi:MAG: hemerythrin family protein [Candidatus Competibacter sp.]|nr:hemerythrin family protein [Candidatus Competibacter sp.]MDG4583540.1 hemerythrin family protein [Candidatus Competibacter sp.]